MWSRGIWINYIKIKYQRSNLYNHADDKQNGILFHLYRKNKDLINQVKT